MPIQYTAGAGELNCPVCHRPLEVRLACSRRSGKSSLMVVCPGDGRHFRGFINDAGYVKGVLARLEDRVMPEEPGNP